MPSKGRWTLNPRKWFGTLSSAAPKSEGKHHINNMIPSKSSTISTTTLNTLTGAATAPKKISVAPSIPSLLTARKKAKVVSGISLNESNGSNSSTPLTQLQLAAFHLQREKSASLLTTTTTVTTTKPCSQTIPLIPMRTEPSIRKKPPLNGQLSIDATRLTPEIMVHETPKVSALAWQSSQQNFTQQNPIHIQSEINISILSNECIIDYPQTLSQDSMEKCHSPRGTNSSSSSMDDNDPHDESTSSGVFTDERADVNDRHHTASKETLLTLDAHSVESIDDYPMLLNRSRSQSFVQSYRLPQSTFEINETKSSQLPFQVPLKRPNRPKSAEGILKDTQTNTPILTRNRQSSAAIVKKIEKRCVTNRSPIGTLEKVGLVRTTNDTYRLASDKDYHLYRRQRRTSVIQYSGDDESLPPANDEESYAAIPRTSSTEQLNDNLQEDVRAIIDDCLRPVVATASKLSDKSKKYNNNNRSKRPHINSEHVQINIEEMIDKLVSSIDCSTYAQFQRC